MDSDRLLQLVFIVYCAAVGTMLILIPWSPGWDLMVARLHHPSFSVLGGPWVRGGLSGFGVVHLVWCGHDVDHLLRRATAVAHPPSERPS
ncbi:MAG: hypothetical protein AAGN46_08650 [Acidobacteriota bacterium]